MKVLIVRTGATEMNLDSYNLQEVGLARALARRGNSCDIIYYTTGECRVEEIEGGEAPVRLFWLPAKSVAGDALFEGIDQMVSAYDVVQVAEYDRLQSVELYRKYPNVVIYHGPYKQDIDSLHTLAHRGKECLFDLLHTRRKANEDVIALSKSTLATGLLRKRGFRDVRTVGVGLDTAKFDDSVPAAETRRRYNLLMIGRLHPNKNTLFALDVLERIVEKEPDTNLFLIGSGKGKYADEVKGRLLKEPVASHVMYIESLPQEKIAPYYKAADFYLLPSVYEIFGMVLLEAAYFGCPFIASASGGALTLTAKGECGVVMDRMDAQEWADAVLGLLHDEARRSSISRSARALIRDHFTWDALADEFIDAYTKAASRG